LSHLITRIPVTITSGQYLSSAANFDGKAPTILLMPAAWDAAAISFATSHNDTDFYFHYDTVGVIISLPANSGRRINLPSTLGDTNGIKVASGVPGTTVNQTADRVLYFELWE